MPYNNLRALHKESHFGIARGALQAPFIAPRFFRAPALGCNFFSCLATRFYSPDAAAVQTHWLVMALLWLFANFIALHSKVSPALKCK
jgi:hypothetical protein